MLGSTNSTRPRKRPQLIGMRSDDLLEGEHIRKFEDGMDVLEDYFIDSCLEPHIKSRHTDANDCVLDPQITNIQADADLLLNPQSSNMQANASGFVLEPQSTDVSITDLNNQYFEKDFDPSLINVPNKQPNDEKSWRNIAENANTGHTAVKAGENNSGSCERSVRALPYISDISSFKEVVLPKKSQSINLNDYEAFCVEQQYTPKADFPPRENDAFLNISLEKPQTSHSLVSKWLDACEKYNADHPEPLPGTSGAGLVEEEPAYSQSAVRRSDRIRHPPLDFWRNERILYKYTAAGDIENLGVDPGTTDHAAWHSPRNIPEPKKHQRQTKKAGVKRVKSTYQMPPELKNGVSVYNSDISHLVNARVILPYKSFSWVNPQPSNIFKGVYITKAVDAMNFSFGFIRIKGMRRKPPMVLSGHNVVFVVVQGKVEIAVHNTTTILKKKDMFIVPNGNTYSLQNLQNNEALLSFSASVASFLHELRV